MHLNHVVVGHSKTQNTRKRSLRAAHGLAPFEEAPTYQNTKMQIVLLGLVRFFHKT